MRRIIEIQQELKAPKTQFNSFGGYKYRNAEDILEAVKPLLKKYDLALILNDEIINCGTRYYVMATATVFDSEGKVVAVSSACAREDETKKGQDGSQITGSSSSYARKYALNGLFAIDDTKDSDYTNTHDKTPDPDTDIIEGLKACSSYVELSKYYKDNFNAVKDKEAFNKLATRLKAKFSQKENQNDVG